MSYVLRTTSSEFLYFWISLTLDLYTSWKRQKMFSDISGGKELGHQMFKLVVYNETSCLKN